MRLLHATYHVDAGGVQAIFQAYQTLFCEYGIDAIAAVPNTNTFKGLYPDRIIEPALAARRLILPAFFAARLRKQLVEKTPHAIVLHNGRALKLMRHAWPEVSIIVVNHGGNVSKMVGAEHIISINRKLREQAVAAGQPRLHTSIIPNFISHKNPQPALTAKGSAVPVIGLLGRLEHSKGIHLFLEAVCLLHAQGLRFRVRIAGDGALKHFIKHTSLRHQLPIVCEEWTHEPLAFLSKLDILCLPSLQETFGLVLIEAMSCGVAVVATDCDGPKEILHGTEAGVLVEKNAVALATGLAKLIKNSDLRRTLAARGKTLVEQRYTKHRVGPRIINLLRGYTNRPCL